MIILLAEIVLALVVGLALGYVIGARGKGRAAAGASGEGAEKEWWDLRDTLTGTQLQILQYLEAKKETTITAMHEKFSFIPDRELYYRLEQITLLGFANRTRKHNDVVYKLNPEYAARLEKDSTVILPED